MFELHPQLAKDCILIDELPLCRLLLMNNAHFPWLILVPRMADKREIHELSDADQSQLLREVSHVARELQRITGAFKMNIAALGNQVPQLHLHVIARFEGDAAWPNPVWSGVAAHVYSAEERAKAVERLRPISEAYGR